MNTRKIYRIEAKTTDTIFSDMIMMAALSNGGHYTPLNKIADAADWLCLKYPVHKETHTVNRIGDNVLTIDKGTENIIMITEVDIVDLQPDMSSQDARDILDELAPTLNRYKGTGTDDEQNNMELLN